jgi:hypothetical protein
MVKTIERWHLALLLPTIAVVGCTAILGLGDPTVDSNGGSSTGSGSPTGNPGSSGAIGASGSAAPAGGTSGASMTAGAGGAGGSSSTTGGAAGNGASGSTGAAGSRGSAGSGGGSDAGVDLTRFLGVWKTTTGTTALTNCSDGLTYPPQTAISVTIVVTRGTSSDLVLTDASGCSLKANVIQNSATIVSGQVCMSKSNNITDTNTFAQGSGFLLEANGTTAELVLQGSDTATNGTDTLACKFENYFPLSK